MQIVSYGDNFFSHKPCFLGKKYCHCFWKRNCRTSATMSQVPPIKENLSNLLELARVGSCSLLFEEINYCPFYISWKDVFCLAFYFKWKHFVLIDHILLETICPLCFCVLFSNIYTKIKVTAKSRSDLCNFYSKVIFLNFCLRKYFLLFFAEFELLIFYNNNVKISEKLNKWNLLKIWLQVTYPIDFCVIWLHFYYGKKWKYLIF